MVERSLIAQVDLPSQNTFSTALQLLKNQHDKTFKAVTGLLGIVAAHSPNKSPHPPMAMFSDLWALQSALKDAISTDASKILCGYGVFSTEDGVREFLLQSPRVMVLAITDLCVGALSSGLANLALADATESPAGATKSPGASRATSASKSQARSSKDRGISTEPERKVVSSVEILWQRVKKDAASANTIGRKKIWAALLSTIEAYATLWCLSFVLDAKLCLGGKGKPAALSPKLPQLNLVALRADSFCSELDKAPLASIDQKQAKAVHMACVLPALELQWSYPTVVIPTDPQERLCTSRWMQAI